LKSVFYLPARIKLFGEGGTPKAFVILGAEKSSISLLKMMPVFLDLILAPKLQVI